MIHRKSTPNSQGPRILVDTTLPSERWKLKTAPGEYASISSTFMAEIVKNEVFCMIRGTVQCLPCKNFEVHSNAPVMHQQQYLVQPANTQESLNIQPSKKFWKMEGDGSLAPPPLLLDKGAYWTKGGGFTKFVLIFLGLLMKVHHFLLKRWIISSFHDQVHLPIIMVPFPPQ